MRSGEHRLKTRKWLGITNALIIIFVCGVAFNNCSPVNEGQSQSSSFAVGWPLGVETCEALPDEEALFVKTYHPFLTNNCASCHSGGGPGPGSFASSGPALAFADFDARGFTKINQMAVNNHSSSASSANQPTIDRLSQNYVSGLEFIDQCKRSGSAIIDEDQDKAGRLQLRSVPVGLAFGGAPREVTWNFQTQILNPPPSMNLSNFSGVSLIATVQLFQRAGIVSYIVSNPRIRTTQGDILIKSLLFKINGVPTPAQRAFYLTTASIRAWNSNHPDFCNPPSTASQAERTACDDKRRRAELISGGSLIMLGQLSTTDVISVSIEDLQRVTLPPPALPPAIRFSQVSQSVQEGYRIIDIPFTLDAPAEGGASAEVFFDAGTTIIDECCAPARNEANQAISIDNFNRNIQDYDKVKSEKLNRRIAHNFNGNAGRYLISFRTGDMAQTLRIKIVDNERYEPGNRVLRLTIDPASLNKLRVLPESQSNANRTYTLTILDNDVAHSGDTERYQDLLRPGVGLFDLQCLRCHNSIQNSGGYDITNYEQMRDRMILIPRDPSSRMFIRMAQPVTGYQPMPLTGLLPETHRNLVRDWILDGAKNN
jgi:hypothetical protein